MNMDFEKSLTYITKDEHWVRKLLTGSGLLLLSFFIYAIPLAIHMLFKNARADITFILFAVIISLLTYITISGYICTTTNNLIHKRDEILPEWSEVKTHLTNGLKYFIGYFLYFLPLGIIAWLFIATTVISGLSSPEHSFIGGLITSMFVILVLALGLFVYILTMVFLPLMMANFNKELKILSFIDLKNAFNMLKGNVANYFVVILLFIAVGIIGQILCYTLAATIVGLILIPVVYLYCYFVLADVIAQFVHSAENKQKNDENIELNQ